MTESTEKKTVAERATELSEEMLASIGTGQQSVIDAVRKFVDTLDEAMPNLVARAAQEDHRRRPGLGLAARQYDERVPAQHRGKRGQGAAQVGHRKASC